jgi:ribonuclease VapC
VVAVIFIDTSAIVAILADEADAPAFAQAIAQAKRRVTAPHVRLETCMVLATKLNRAPLSAQEDFDAFLAAASVEMLALTDAMSRAAVAAFQRYGKGRGHPAQLNLADCLTYATAQAAGAALLFKGRDFSETDALVAPLAVAR